MFAGFKVAVDDALLVGVVDRERGRAQDRDTGAAGKLQDAGLIRYHRGRITVLDRPRLEARVAAKCYQVVKTEPRSSPTLRREIAVTGSAVRLLANKAGQNSF